MFSFRILCKSGFINEPCSSRNTVYAVEKTLEFPPNNNQPQCIDTSKVSRKYDKRKLFSRKSLQKIQTIYGENSGFLYMFDVSPLEDLEEIYLSHNKIRRFENNIFENNKRLRRVVLDHNNIRIPRNSPILISKSIDTLDLSYNGIRKIYYRSFKGLPNLRILYLKGNELTHIPKYAFSRLNVLKFLQLEENPLVDFSFKKPRNLKGKYIFHDNPVSVIK